MRFLVDESAGTAVVDYFRSGQAHHGVVLLRLRDESPANRVRILKSVLTLHEDRLAAHFTVATEGSVRIRPARLPRE
jgi:hypothetical protein